MKTRKLIAMLMACTMSITTLVGCGDEGETAAHNTASDSKETTAQTTSEASSEVVETEPKEVVEIKINYTGGHDAELTYELVDEFNNTVGKENYINVVVTDMDGDALKLALANGTEPDLFGLFSTAELVEKGYIASYDDYEELANLCEMYSGARMENSNVYDGKTYALPVTTSLYGLAYNKDMFVAAGLVDENGEAKPPATLDEMREYAKILTNEEKGEYGFIYPGKWSSIVGTDILNNSYATSGRNHYDPATGKYDVSAILPLVNSMLNIIDDGSAYPGMEGIDNDPARALFAEGIIGMKFAVTWDVGVWNDQFPAKCDWGIAPIPSVSEDEKYYQLANPSWSYAISQRSVDEKGIEPVSCFLNYWYSDEVQVLFYEGGYSMPWRSEVTEMAGTLREGLVGWDDFAEIRKISKEGNLSHPADTTGYDSFAVDFTNKVMSRQYTPEQWVEERNQIYDEGMKKYKELHPELDYSIYEAQPDYSRAR